MFNIVKSVLSVLVLPSLSVTVRCMLYFPSVSHLCVIVLPCPMTTGKLLPPLPVFTE